MVLRKVIFVRHGESQGNAENVFTGWSHTPLSIRGEQEATEAGLCIKASGIKFDTVFTSVLARATKTTDLVLNNSGNESAPVFKSWKLNARHSGGLQGLVQTQAVAQYGEAKVTVWRSSYSMRPACVAGDDDRHPFNDPLYADVPREQLPPGGESLADVVARIEPYWNEHVVPKIKTGDAVLMVGHKNSFRALWKFIENTPDEDALDAKMTHAGAPLVYEFEDSGEGSGLVFKQKYVMNFPTLNPKYSKGIGDAKVLGKAFLLRHAESVNNSLGVDNGWEDTTLTLKGERQAVEAGLLLKGKNIKVDMIFTSVLQRAVKTAEITCMTSNNAFAVPVFKCWHLNARHSGALHGMSHAEAVASYGEAAAVFRTTPGGPPACLDRADPRHPANDPLYTDVPPEELPGGESYDLMAKRVLPFWDGTIMPHIKAGKNVLVVSHRNPLKAILKHLNEDPGQGSDTAFDGHRSTLPIAVEFVADDVDGSPAVLTQYSLSSFAPQLSMSTKTLGKVVFLRHGESLCNLNESFTGWEDSGLTPKGEGQACQAGQYLNEAGFKFDVVFTSVLTRATESATRICKESGNSSVPVVKSWRMNARHPGVLQGLTKPEANKAYGKEKVDIWRGSYDVTPECVPLSDPRHPANDPLYQGIPREELPGAGGPCGESLHAVVDRVVPFWRDQVAPRIRAGETILVVGHKNGLKALFMYLEDASEHEMFDVRPVSTTAPLVFEFGDPGFNSGLVVVQKYWVKHTVKEALATAPNADGYCTLSS